MTLILIVCRSYLEHFVTAEGPKIKLLRFKLFMKKIRPDSWLIKC